MKLISGLFNGLIVVIGTIFIFILFLLSLLVPSLAIKFGIDYLFDVQSNIFGIFLLLFAAVMLRNTFFSKSE